MMNRARLPVAAAAAAASVGTAEKLLAERGVRTTRARIDVLSVLLAAGQALTHHEVEGRLKKGHDVDRVTLYRVLEWLTEQGIAHKLSGDDRVWRFSVSGRAHAATGAHAHFQCSDCGKVICLDEARMPAISLPRGFRRREVEVTVKGSCDACAG